jgi:hypothetical protein
VAVTVGSPPLGWILRNDNFESYTLTGLVTETLNSD